MSWRHLMLLAALPFAAGCLVNTHSEDVVDPHAERMAVNFENDAALRFFQDEVHHRQNRGDAVLHKGSLAVPFVVAAHEKKVLSENAFYNVQVKKADVDGDGLVTEAEARVFAGKPAGTANAK